jgi:hypothetical protein
VTDNSVLSSSTACNATSNTRRAGKDGSLFQREQRKTDYFLRIGAVNERGCIGCFIKVIRLNAGIIVLFLMMKRRIFLDGLYIGKWLTLGLDSKKVMKNKHRIFSLELSQCGVH